MRSQQKYLLLALITVAICTLAFYIHRHRQGKTGYIDNLFISLTGALQKQTIYFIRGTQSIVDNYVFLVHTKRENQELKREVVVLYNKVAGLEEVSQQNYRLKEALGFREKIALPLLAAHVIAHDVSNDYFGIRIDRGSKDGIEIGMGVISSGGVVGRVLRVSPNFSDVQTLIDPDSRIDVVIQRSRARGILTGHSRQLTCRLRYLDRLEDVVVDDVIVSSAFGKIFPPGLMVGHVTAVIPNPNGVLQTVTVKSIVDIYRLEEVFIVRSNKKGEKVSE